MHGILWRTPLQAARKCLVSNAQRHCSISHALSVAVGLRFMSRDRDGPGDNIPWRNKTHPSLLLRTAPPASREDEPNPVEKRKKEGPNYANVPRMFRESNTVDYDNDDEFDLLNFPSNNPRNVKQSPVKEEISSASSSIPQRVMAHHLREFKKEHPNVTPRQLEAFIKRLEARYGSSVTGSAQNKSNHQVSRERVSMNNQAALSASLAARSGGASERELSQRMEHMANAKADSRPSVADVRAQRELDLLNEQHHDQTQSQFGGQKQSKKTNTQYNASRKAKRHDAFDSSDSGWSYDESYDLMSEESGRVSNRLRGAHGTVTEDGTRILDVHSHPVSEEGRLGEDPELLDFFKKAGQLESAFDNSPFRHYFEAKGSGSKNTKPDEDDASDITNASYVARMKHGEPVYLVGSRRVMSSDRSLDETAYIYMVRQVDMRNLHIHDFVLSADFETGMPFEADVYTHLSPERTTGQVIERDDTTGEIQHRTFIRLLGSPWKWTGAMAISQVAQSVLQDAQKEAKSENVSYTLSRTRFAPFHHYSEKLVRENGETVLTIFDELQVTSEAQYRGATKELYESIQDTMEEEGGDFENFTSGGKKLDVLSSLSSEDASLSGAKKTDEDPFDVVNEILLKYKDGGSNGAKHAMREIEELPSFMNERAPQGGPGKGANGFSRDDLRRMDEDLYDPRRSKKKSDWSGDKKKSKRKF